MSAPIYVFTRADDQPTTIEIWAKDRSAAPVSRRLYGKFTEHLGRNVYHGVWAQILDNPGFEPAGRLAKNGQDMQRQLQGAARNTGREVPTPLTPGIAPYWAPVGAAKGELIGEAVQGVAQRLTTASPGEGLRQPICLPLHRVSSFELTVWVNAQSVNTLQASVLTAEGREVGSAQMALAPGKWVQHRTTITVNAEGLPKGAPLTFQLTLAQPGTVDLDQCFLFPADHVEGLDPDVIRLWREAKLPLLRFPGGNFVSGYHWQDGVGPIDSRPTLPNPAWNCPEYNHVGTDEWMTFCRLVGCEALICVNAGNGTAEEAAAWVEYCNGAASTKYGALRARNGHPEPYNVKLWEIGNEIYGNWQIGHCTAEEYAKRYDAFVRAMRAVDPTIEFIANGNDAKWNDILVKQAQEPVRSLSAHSYTASDNIPTDSPPLEVWRGVVAAPANYYGTWQALAKPLKDAGRPPRIAVTESMIFLHKPELPGNASIAEPLFLAGMLHSAIRLEGLVELYTHTAILNHGGGMSKHREVVFPQPVYFATKLYATTPGRWPLRMAVRGEAYDTIDRWRSAAKNAPYLDALALMDDSGKILSLLVVNRDSDRALTATVKLHDFAPTAAQARVITGPSIMARNTLENPEVVALREAPAPQPGSEMQITFAPRSVTEIVLHTEG